MCGMAGWNYTLYRLQLWTQTIRELVGIYRVICGLLQVMCGLGRPIQSDVRSCQGDVRYSYAHKFVMCGDVRWCVVMCGDVRFSGTPRLDVPPPCLKHAGTPGQYNRQRRQDSRSLKTPGHQRCCTKSDRCPVSIIMARVRVLLTLIRLQLCLCRPGFKLQQLLLNRKQTL